MALFIRGAFKRFLRRADKFRQPGEGPIQFSVGGEFGYIGGLSFLAVTDKNLYYAVYTGGTPGLMQVPWTHVSTVEKDGEARIAYTLRPGPADEEAPQGIVSVGLNVAQLEPLVKFASERIKDSGSGG